MTIKFNKFQYIYYISAFCENANILAFCENAFDKKSTQLHKVWHKTNYCIEQKLLRRALAGIKQD